MLHWTAIILSYCQYDERLRFGDMSYQLFYTLIHWSGTQCVLIKPRARGRIFDNDCG